MKHDHLEDLIEAVAQRDGSAFSQLYVLTSGRVTAIAFSILLQREDAEEAAQEIYIKIWRQAALFERGGGSGKEWIGAIARNHSIDAARGRKPSASCIDDEINLAFPGPNPEELSVASSDRTAVNRSLEMLEPGRADAVRQAYVHGFSYQQLAEIHSVPINTMRTWLRRSLVTLRKSLA